MNLNNVSNSNQEASECEVMLRPPPLEPHEPPPPQPLPPPPASIRPKSRPKQPSTPPPMRLMRLLEKAPPPIRLLEKVVVEDRIRSPERPPSWHNSVPASRRSPSPPRSVSPSPEADVVAPDGYWQCLECRSLNSSSGMRSMFCSNCDCRKPLQSTWEKGDWYCETCGNHNYQGRTRCNNTWCPSMTKKPGDWICSTCGNHNYSSRKNCNSKTCSGTKPSKLKSVVSVP